MVELSIIIPVYNAGIYLNDCLNSIFEEKKKFTFEVIIVNDGSTDNSEEIVNRFIDCGHKIVYFYKENEGVSTARNIGISLSSGKYLMFVDADDKLEIDWGDIIFDKIIGTDLDVIYFSDYFEDLNVSKKQLMLAIIGYFHFKGASSLSGPWSKLFSRRLVDKILFDKEIFIGEDMIYNLEVISNAKKWKFVNKSFYSYRQNIESSSSTIKSNYFKSNDRFLIRLRDYLLSVNCNFSFKERQKVINFSVENSLIHVFVNGYLKGDFPFRMCTKNYYKRYFPLKRLFNLEVTGFKKRLVLCFYILFGELFLYILSKIMFFIKVRGNNMDKSCQIWRKI